MTCAPSERRIQRAILRRLAEVLPADAFWFHVANQTAAPPEYARALLGDGLKPGVPDLILVYLQRVYALEVKRPGEHPTPVQLAIHERMRRAGCPVAVARSPDDAEEALRGWGLPVARWAA